MVPSCRDSKQAVINTISVDSWEAGARAVSEAGGKVLTEKNAIPGLGYTAYCRDTEGNVFGIFQADETAALAAAPAGAVQEKPTPS